MKKKIAMLLDSEPEWGGQHQYACTLASCMLRLNDVELVGICSNQYWRSWCRKNNVRVLSVRWPVFTERGEKYHLKWSAFSRIYSMYMTEMGKKISEEKIQAVLSAVQGVFIPNFDVKIITPVHDLMHRYEGRFPEVREHYWGREVLFSSVAKYAWCILTDSKIGKEQFKESYSKYISEGHTHIVSLPFVVSEDITTRQEEFIDVPEKYIFYPAQFWKHKNHINLIKAVKLLITDIPEIHLVLVGSEKNCRKGIERYISEHKLSDHITIKGFVSDGNITYLYRHAVGMVMPSYFGPTNIPPLEAMALGCPTAVSNKYAMPEQVGNAGLLFDPDSPEEIAACIKIMWLNESIRQEMIRKGHQIISKWNIESFAERLQKIVNQI